MASPWKTNLPPWTDESPLRLYELFCLHQKTELQGPTRDEYTLLLMNAITLQFQRCRWNRSLRYLNLDPEDVAQATVAHLFKKSQSMPVRHPCWKVMLKIFNKAIYFFVTTIIQGRQRKPCRELTATDYYTERGKPSEELDSHSIAPDAEIATSGTLKAQLLESEDAVIGDIITSGKEFAAIEQLFVLCRDELMAGRPVPSHKELPPDLREEVSLELHALVGSRLYRSIRTSDQH